MKKILQERIAAFETTGRALANVAAEGADSGDWRPCSACDWAELVAFQAVLDEVQP